MTEATYRWFGEDWGAPANDPELQIRVPVDAICMECVNVINADDSGVRIPHLGKRTFSHFHRDCFLKSIGVPVQPEGDLDQ